MESWSCGYWEAENAVLFDYGFSQSSEGFACEGNARQKSTRYAGVSQEVIQLKSPFRYNVVVQVTIAGKER